ncbi:MAG: hypothetical protein N2A99_05560 [Carnobacterium alterfunditum]
MFKRIIGVFLSAVILGLGVAVLNYVPQNQRESDVYYLGEGVYFILTLWVYLLFYLVVVVPSSWIIDKCRKRFKRTTITNQYLIGVALYSLAGLFLGTAYYLLMVATQNHLNNFIETLAFWVIALFLYFQVLWVLERGFLEKIIRREKSVL